MVYQISLGRKIQLPAVAATYGDVSLAEARTRDSVDSLGAYLRLTRSRKWHGRGCVGRLLADRWAFRPRLVTRYEGL